MPYAACGLAPVLYRAAALLLVFVLLAVVVFADGGHPLELAADEPLTPAGLSKAAGALTFFGWKGLEEDLTHTLSCAQSMCTALNSPRRSWW